VGAWSVRRVADVGHCAGRLADSLADTFGNPGPRRHQASDRPSRNSPPLGPPLGIVTAQTIDAAPSERAPIRSAPGQVAVRPGQAAFDQDGGAASSAASVMVSAFCAALLMS
jgi:hypothetical protein